MTDPDAIALTVSSNLPQFDGSRVRRTYEWLVDHMTLLNCAPTHIGFAIRGQHQNYKSFNRMRRHVDAFDWNTVTSISLKSLKADRDLETRGAFDWTSEADVGCDQVPREPPAIRNTWRANWTVIPLEADISEVQTLEHFIAFARTVVDRYGFISFMPKRFGPGLYHVGLQLYGSGRTDDQNSNIGAWSMRNEHFHHYLLRDVYRFNFLAKPYLDLPVGRTTLAQWIRADDSRGVLEPLTDKVTTWRPVVENIPIIREQLFRAGVMFYWRHFDPFDPMYRDFSKPWKPPDEIPEMFRAEFYKNRDPSITR